MLVALIGLQCRLKNVYCRFGSVWECVGVCGSVWECVGVCESVWECVRVCGSVWECVGVCESVWECVGVSEMLRTWGSNEDSWVLHRRSLSDCLQLSRLLLLFTIARALYSGVTTVRVSYCISWQNFICTYMYLVYIYFNGRIKT